MNTLPATRTDDAATLWRACAQLIAGAPRLRIGRRSAGGRLVYEARHERALTDVRPLSPAAVMVYGPDGCCATLCLDLDVGRGGTDAVARDVAHLERTLTAAGARWIADRSSSGGVHLYVPLLERLPYDQARSIVEALSADAPTLDPSPHRSLRSGCIRVPGAAHRDGGHQQLLTPLAAAYDTLRRRNAPEVVQALTALVGAHAGAWRTEETTTVASTAGDDTAGAHASRGALGHRLRTIAETGLYDTARYASASEARQAVIAGAVRAGWQLTDVATRLADGRWPGLASLYARYSPNQRHRALARDWRSASTWLTERANDPASNLVRRSHTSASETQRGPLPAAPDVDEHGFIRTWRTALRLTEHHRLPGRGNHLARFLLRALGEAAHKTGSRYVAFGTRALAVATGTEHSSVAAVLRRLSDEPDGWIDRIEPARGENADLYELRLPVDLQGRVPRWDRGRAHALRPAFRELGHVAAFVFETIEAGRAATVLDAARAAGVSRSAAHDAVEALHAHGLVDRTHDGLAARPDRLLIVAEQLGVLEVVAAQLRRHRLERARWRAFLERHDADAHDDVPADDDAERWWWPPDDDVGWTLTDTAAHQAA
ncbi:MarR family transcriptional regulator [Cellulomonas sp. 179-A 9B4 NHS]|uniref:MarR family transcriptional regulator n=1 Tax=Cellulomonas sp. 179-A 9B4 NHS TaxID=3142379 RepID=UPI0039A20F44